MVGVARWTLRVDAYVLLLVDRYPQSHDTLRRRCGVVTVQVTLS